MVIFTIIASGIIIFVPVYKRYFKRDNGKEKKKQFSLKRFIVKKDNITKHTDNKFEILNTINTPEDLRKLQVNELPEVCKELRQFIIKELSKNPGHFASSMGAVEITVALHYVFNTPYDRIVWDVGHQAYSHKIGRAHV